MIKKSSRQNSLTVVSRLRVTATERQHAPQIAELIYLVGYLDRQLTRRLQDNGEQAVLLRSFLLRKQLLQWQQEKYPRVSVLQMDS